MARLKKQGEATEQQAPQTENKEIVNTSENPSNEESEEIDNEIGGEEKETPETPQTENKIENTELPEYVDRILKMYPNYEELAIDQQGGIYTKESQHLSNGKAILYQNPYYK